MATLRGVKPLIVLVLAAVLAGACGGDGRQEITGVVVRVDSQGLTEVTGFTLKAGDRLYDIAVDPGITYSFPLDHLNAHKASAQPVTVVVERRAGRLHALQITDA